MVVVENEQLSFGLSLLEGLKKNKSRRKSATYCI